MELLLSVVGNRPGVRRDLAVDVQPTHTVAELASSLRTQLREAPDGPIQVWRNNAWRLLSPEAQLDTAGLVSGDTISIADRPRLLHDQRAAGAVRVAVTFGPDAGTAHELVPGRHQVGRSTDAQVPVNDLLVSRHQFDLVVDAQGAVNIEPNVDAANPTRVDGQTISAAVALEPGQVIQVGSTRLRIRESLAAPAESSHFADIGFQRTPYFRLPLVDKTFEAIAKLPQKPKPRRLTLLASMMPMVMGIGMVLMLGSMRYLMFAVFSPIMAVGTWYDQRRQGGKDYDEAIENFDERLEKRRSEVEAALRAERQRRLHNNPDLELLARRVDSQHNELWQRDRDADDFLSLRIGVGAGTPQVTISPETSGDEEYQDLVAKAMESYSSLSDIPIAVDLDELGTVALVGAAADTVDLTAALVTQAACLHSPEDVVIAAAVAPRSGVSNWLKWLPHTRASSSPIGGALIAEDTDAAENLLRAITRIAETRAGNRSDNIDRRWPWMVVVIDDHLDLDASVVSRLLDLGAPAGLSVIWMTDSHSRVPRQAEAVVECQPADSGQLSSIRYTDHERDFCELDTERLAVTRAASIARSLAPMRDATAADAVTSIPRIVTLFDSLGVASVDPAWIASQWQTDRGYSLTAPIGSTDSGPIQLDLVEHGPHGLIGGTSGAGKSELVQSLVVNLAAMNPPDKLNFLFVDYKGGALSEMFKDIPHTVGAVTNLDALLALRALTSLTAELDRRMELFKGRAPDIRTMIERFPDEAPASLVIVVDEFAALVRELPEFVDGVVSIAERGRSLGIHLLMSTQRPSGAINDNIQQNTNLRIALRMLDVSESANVINAPDAAMIPTPLKGRGLARLGPGELIPFQSAWSGAPLLAEAGPPPVRTAEFVANQSERAWSKVPGTPSPDNGIGPRTQLDATVEAIIATARDLGHRPGRAPWKEMLPSSIELTAVLDDPRSLATDHPGRQLTIGMIDDPAAQDQYPASIDFNDGAIAIFGAGGAGKTTTLQTIAAAAAIRDHEAGGGTVTMFALDFASRGLGLLARLPQTSAVATGDDLEAVTRILSLIDRQLARRQALLAASVAAGEPAPDFAQILLLVDGWDNFAQVFEGRNPTHNLAIWSELAERLITDGRQYGITVALSAYRRASLRSGARTSLTTQLVLRQTEEVAYIDFGIPAKVAKGLELAPGQAFLNGQMLQIARIAAAETDSGSDDADSAMEAFVAFAESIEGRVAPELVTAPLPETTRLTGAIDPRPTHVQLGTADASLQPVTLDLTHNNVVVTGPPRSGRSTALRTIGRQCIDQDWQVWAIGTPGTPLAALPDAHRCAFGRVADVVATLEELAAEVLESPGVPRLLLNDDVDLFDDRSLSDPLETIIAEGVRIVGVLSSMRAYGSNPLFDELKRARTMLILQPDGPRDIQDLTGVIPDLRPGVAMPPGRGVLIADRVPTVLQVGDLDAPDRGPAVAGPSDDVTMMPPALRGSGSAAAPTTTAMPKQPELVVSCPATRRCTPIGASLLVGRRQGQRPTLVLEERYVSAEHLLIELRGGEYFVTDLGSRNGTTLRRGESNERRLKPNNAVAVMSGDCLTIGDRQLVFGLASASS